MIEAVTCTLGISHRAQVPALRAFRTLAMDGELFESVCLSDQPCKLAKALHLSALDGRQSGIRCEKAMT